MGNKVREKEHHIDLSAYCPTDRTAPVRKEDRLVRFAGRIVSFANLLPPRQARHSSIPCRRRPNRRPCAGNLEIERDSPVARVRWRCPICRDAGVVTGWRDTRWDLTAQLQSGDVVSLFQAQAKRSLAVDPTQRVKVFELQVELIGGPLALDHAVMRRVRIGGDNRLHDLHGLIMAAFDWREDEPYDFMFGAPYEPGARRFTGGVESADEEAEAICETRAITLEELDLIEGQVFGYLFDFGEEWVHRITVVSVGEVTGFSVRPRVLESVGKSPPQHPEADEPWEEDLLWAELEDEYPITSLYGPYVADEAPDADVWSSMEELEQLLWVIESHAQRIESNHPPIESMALHAVVHCLAESKLAAGDRDASKQLAGRASEGVCRHEAIHELGELLVHELLRGPTATPSQLPKRARRGSQGNSDGG